MGGSMDTQVDVNACYNERKEKDQLGAMIVTEDAVDGQYNSIIFETNLRLDFPSLTALEMLNVARMPVMLTNTVVSAKWEPIRVLQTLKIVHFSSMNYEL